MSVMVPFIVLAEHAVADDGGRFDIVRGFIERLDVPRLPHTQTRLSLAVAFAFTEDESLNDHRIAILGSTPRSESLVRAELRVRIPRTVLRADGTLAFPFVYNMNDLVFHDSGSYIFDVLVDDNKLASTHLTVATPAEGAQDLLQRGFNEYESGHVSGAERIMRQVVKADPLNAGGHNNLGFLLLEKGKAAEALEQFRKAEELAYPLPELLHVNIGCARYALHDYQGALDSFRAGFSRPFGSYRAFLLGVAEDQSLFPLSITSAADYVWLLELNAAWSAFGIGDMQTARRHALAANSKDYRGAGDDKMFQASVAHLLSQLS
jgi:tetratricopeptide (TPR) repeat protein